MSHPNAPAGPPPALATAHLTKVYGQAPAVYDVNLVVPQGSMFGLVGPSGAGKTTLLSMATGLVRPSSGGAFVAGHDVWAGPVSVRGRIGILPDGPAVPEALSGARALHYVGVLQGLSPEDATDRAHGLLGALDLLSAGDKPISTYSAGMKKKIGLAAALIHSPPLLVLDEPLEAVDPVSAVGIRDILTQFVSRGGTAVVSSHSMTLIEQLCSHVAILNHGHLVVAGTVDDVRAGGTLEAALVRAVGAPTATGDLSWLGH